MAERLMAKMSRLLISRVAGSRRDQVARRSDSEDSEGAEGSGARGARAGRGGQVGRGGGRGRGGPPRLNRQESDALFLRWLAMGAYLSRPVTDKDSSDETSEAVDCGASSMQGWRVMQEDAHNCIIQFDADTSLFAVFDGHGGPEVAKYCSMRLPQFLKGTEAYLQGDYVKALEDAYIGFDATIAEPETVKLLYTLTGGGEPQADDLSDEEDNVHNLCEEARMPLDEVMAKYKNKVHTIISDLKAESSSKPLSPKLKPVKPGDGGACSSSSGNGGGGSGGAGSSNNGDFNEAEPVSSTSLVPNNRKKDDQNESQVSTSNGVHAAPDSPAQGISSTADSPKTSPKKTNSPSDVGSSVSNEAEQSDREARKSESHSEKKNSKDEAGASDPSKSCGPSGQPEGGSRPSKDRAPGFYNNFLNDSDDSDSNDENFEGETRHCESSSDEENIVNGADGDTSDEDPDEEDSSSDIEMEDEDEMECFALSIKNEPGSNSGCTAVVALLHCNQLYVANAGDSRCVVSRNGKAHDMSIDHKPEDPLELERIKKAGGKVSLDGRVNRGLNLSRAIGDLGYKQNRELGPKEQMITAFPDVTTMTINPETDNFMVIACDGIWNYMSSQNVIDFIAERLAKADKLSKICEEMFDHCLAPNSMGDGTGCDNMTALIVKFKPSLKIAPSPSDGVKKRTSDEDVPEEGSKRLKTDTENSDVTSSV